jgi:hypothetical protein
VSARPAALAAVLVALLFTAGSMARHGVWGSFTGSTPSAGNSITAASDFRAPAASASAIGKTAGGATGSVKKGGTYYVYANVADSGSPASGTATVTANVSSLTTGSTAAALSSGNFSAGGVSYNYRSAALTAGSTLAAGSYSYLLTLTDAAANSATQSGFSVTVDNTVPTATDVQTANGSTTVGLPQQGDTVTFTFSEPIEPVSILAGWSGAATGVVVRLTNGSGSGNDTLAVYNAANSAQLPLGSVNLGRADYTSANLTFGASGTASSMAMSGSTVTVTLGTQSAAATTAAATGTMTWTPSATATDLAGNAVSTTAATESGAADREF